MNRTELLKVAKPILFSTEMVRAIQDGRKTVTRRVIKPQPKARLNCIIQHDAKGRSCWTDGVITDNVFQFYDTFGVGDILYVRETWAERKGIFAETHGRFEYRADFTEQENEYRISRLGKISAHWHPSIHMPKAAARIFLRVTAVRVERLQEITEDDAIAEGVTPNGWDIANESYGYVKSRYIRAFEWLWNSTIKKADIDKYGWNANPWVWVYEFERVVEE